MSSSSFSYNLNLKLHAFSMFLKKQSKMICWFSLMTLSSHLMNVEKSRKYLVVRKVYLLASSKNELINSMILALSMVA